MSTGELVRGDRNIYQPLVFISEDESMAMRKPGSVRSLEALGRVRLSESFYFREFLCSETAMMHGLDNVPDNPDMAIEAGRRLCSELLEPLQQRFGRISVRSGFRSCEVNGLCHRLGLACASNERNYGRHIWDRRDRRGNLGAMATVVVPWFADWTLGGGDWRAMAWWIHDHLPYSHMQFFPKLAAFNIGWLETPLRRIDSFVHPRGCLTRPGKPDHGEDHAVLYADLLADRARQSGERAKAG